MSDPPSPGKSGVVIPKLNTEEAKVTIVANTVNPSASEKEKKGGSAKTKANSSASLGTNCNFQKVTNGKSSLVRLDFCKELKQLPVIGKNYDLNMEYCYVSQRGYYPTSLGKANQDSYLVAEKFLGDVSCNVFGIFDGHGEYGDECSFYAADRFPHYLADEVEKNGGLTCLDGEKMMDVVTKAFVNTNAGLRKAKIDDSLSGTTAIVVIQRGDRLIVANVGDSRAIIASDHDGKLQFSPLSSDQTPYRKDERERLKKCGATILTMEQLEGNEPIHDNYATDLGQEIDEGGDPPRVWDSTLEKPGCAFSRSIGDSVGEAVGICPDPEILEWNVRPDDKFAVIASDGVFEFITSQNVVNMIQKHANKLEAAKHVVAESYRLWLTYDDRTDDISIIIISFNNLIEKIRSSPAKLTRSLSKALSSDHLLKTSRPVRTVMSKAKRKDISDTWEKDDAVNIDFDNLPNNKTEEEIARISTMLSTSFMFENVSPIQKDHIYKVMKARDVASGEQIIKEGDQGDEMYIVDKGEFNVFKKDEHGEEQLVFVYTEQGAAFGELSLMYGKPRAASVIAKTAGKLWSIDRAAFRAVMMKGKSEGLLEVYRTLPVLIDKDIPTLHRLCLATKELHFEKGDLIVDQTTAAATPWEICVIINGVIRLVPKKDSKADQLRAELCYLSVVEIGSKFLEARADSKLKISCVPREIWREVVVQEEDEALKQELQRKKTKGKRLQAKENFNTEASRKLEKLSSSKPFQFDYPLQAYGEFGYIGHFNDSANTRPCTIKVYAKHLSHKARTEKGIINDRNNLGIIANHVPNKNGLPTAIATFQDERWVYLVLSDIFSTDLSLAINHHVVLDEAKPLYMASLLSAIGKIHQLGLIHRAINSGSVYITSSGHLKLVDFRLAKRMDGAYCFTICGDPLYFAPEIISQQGYDYAVDLWAFGITLYELHEGSTPFGNADTDETTIYRAISGYRPSRLNFSQTTTTSAKQLISDLLRFGPEERSGYKDFDALKTYQYFAGIDWDKIEDGPGYPVDIQPSIELAHILDADAVQPYKSTILDKF